MTRLEGIAATIVRHYGAHLLAELIAGAANVGNWAGTVCRQFRRRDIPASIAKILGSKG